MMLTGKINLRMIYIPNDRLRTIAVEAMICQHERGLNAVTREVEPKVVLIVTTLELTRFGAASDSGCAGS